MKKLYFDPDLEIVNIRLVADVLVDSKETEHPSYDGGGGDEFEDGDIEEI